MMFYKTNNIYKVTRITGNQDNILGVCFTEKDNQPIEIIEWNIKTNETIKTSRSEIESQVVSGLKQVNQALNTNYRLSKIYYVPTESPNGAVYALLIRQLIRHLHSGKVFKEV